MNESTRGDKVQRVVLPLLGAGLLVALHGTVMASGGGGEGGQHLNWTDFMLRVVNFTIMAAILYKLLKKPAGGFFVSRRENIQKMLAELEGKKKEAELKTAEYKAKMAGLEEETKKIVDELIVEGETERKKIIESAKKQAEYITQQAHLAVQQEIKVAREKLQEQIAELSVAAAEDILRKKMKAEDQERLVRDFMTRVVEAK